MALKNGYYYVVNPKTQKPNEYKLGRYVEKADVFMIDTFAVKVSDCRQYSKYGYEPKDLLEIDVQLDDLVTRVLALENVVSLVERNDLSGAVIAAQDYLNAHVYFDPVSFVSRSRNA